MTLKRVEIGNVIPTIFGTVWSSTNTTSEYIENYGQNHSSINLISEKRFELSKRGQRKVRIE